MSKVTNPAKLSAERSEEIRQRAEKATEGPWQVVVDGCARCREEGKEGEYDIDPLEQGYHALLSNKADADFIAHARQDIPDLLAHISALEGELADSRTNHIDANERNMRSMDELSKARQERDEARVEFELYKAARLDQKQRAESAEAALRSRDEAGRELLSAVNGFLQFVPCAPIDERIALSFKAEVEAAAARLEAVMEGK